MESNTHTPTGTTAFAQTLSSNKGIPGYDIKDEDLPAFYWFRRFGLLEYQHKYDDTNTWTPIPPNNAPGYTSFTCFYRFKHRT